MDRSCEASPPRRRRLIVKLLFSGVSIALGLGLCEVLLRLVAPQPPSWLDVYRRHPTLATYTLQTNVERLVDTGESRWTVKSDADGFRVSRNGSAGGATVLCLGDSFTFGYGVDHEQSFVGLLQSQAGSSARWVNAAVPGFGPVQYVQVLQYLLDRPLTPRYLLVGTFVGNDFHDCIWRKEAQVRDGVIGHRGDLRSFAKLNSHLYRLGSKCFHRFAPGREDDFQFQEAMAIAKNWDESSLKSAAAAYREQFQKLAALCRDHSIQAVVVVIPTRGAVEAAARSAGTDSGPRLPADQASKILENLGLANLDLTPSLAALDADQLYFRHDGHFTPLGHRVAAEAIARKLHDLNWSIP